MKQSDLEAKREAAAYTSDVGSSLGDSEESEYEPGHEFDVDDILAQRIDETDDGDVLQYLVKFTDYPIYECKWLTQSELNCKEVFRRWRDTRKGLTVSQLEELEKSKDEEVKAAQERAAAAKARRQQKRAKLKEEAEQKKRESLKKKGVARKKAPSTRVVTPAQNKGTRIVSSARKRRVIMSSDDESFVASSDGESGSPSSDDESASSSSDSEPLFQRLAKSKAQPTRTEPASSAKAVSRPSSPQKRRKSSAGVSSSTNQPSAIAPPSAATGRRPSMPIEPSVTNEQQSGPRAPGAIKLVNEPKQHQRKPWDTHGHHFKTLHYRAVAEKRGRAEGTPDINELEFVNGAPAGISVKSGDTTSRTIALDNPYGRREPGQRRLAEIEADDKPEPSAPTTGVELQPYEKGKIPMTCFDWKNGNACRHTADRCRFLHREQGQDGKTLPVTTWDGRVPPKYRDPPLMCWYWFCEDSCTYPDDDCVYAHKNTGHLPMRDHKTRPVDPHIEPGSAAAREIGGVCNYTDVTCWNWLMDTKGCYKSADQCNFAHRNTGLLGSTIGADFKPIDPKQAPVYARQPPKFQDPPQTCYFWLRKPKGCDKSADDCKYAHENTGWLADAKHGPCRIDRNEKPASVAATHRPSIPTGPASTNAASHRHVPKHSKTCFFWNEYKCRLPEEECNFLHRYTGVVADPPSHRPSTAGWRPHFRDEPVSAQVHEPGMMEVDAHPLTHFDSPEPMQMDEPAVKPRHESTLQSVNTRDDGNKSDRPAHPPVEDPLYVLPQEENDRITAIPDIQPVDMSRTIGEVAHLDVDEMFRCNGDQHEDVIASPNALLLYNPNEHLEELGLLERWLAMHSVNGFSSLHMGLSAAWHAFKQLILDGGSGIIIAAPDFEGYASLPGFGDVLRGTVRLWSVGTQVGVESSIWDPKASSETHFDRFAIFPHGGIIYITDDVFEKRPQLALSIFEQFFTKLEAGRKIDSDVIPGMYINDGLLLWRLGARPELVRWIGDICMNHQAEIEEGDPDYVSLEKLYVLLQDSGYCEPDGTFDHPADNRRLDFFPIISMRQSLAEDVGLYYEARTRSQHEANTDMAHHYSGLVVMERRNYRHYFVVHTDPEMVDWKDTITNIDEVITPEKCIEYFEQEPKGSKFDNYEWAYPEKRADSVTAPVTDSAPQKGPCDACGLDSTECPCRYL